MTGVYIIACTNTFRINDSSLQYKNTFSSFFFFFKLYLFDRNIQYEEIRSIAVVWSFRMRFIPHTQTNGVVQR